jgi:integrase
VRALASRIFRYAIATARAEHDPCPALRGAIATPQVKSHAALLDPAAIGGLMRAIRTYTGEPTIRLAMELSAHVFQRPGEIRQALWSEIDLAAAIWTIPAARMKMRQPHRVPLSKRAVEILTEAHELTGAGDFVFPSLRTTKRPMSENTVNAALRRYGAKRGFELQAYRSRLLVPSAERQYHEGLNMRVRETCPALRAAPSGKPLRRRAQTRHDPVLN